MPTENTPNLGLPLIAAQQAQKHVTHNEALRALDALVQATVKDRDLASPPATLQEGDCYIVATGATGDWAGQENAIAEFRNGGWVFHAPQVGWLAFAEDEAAFLFFDGNAWQNLAAAIAALQNLLKLGINTTADDTNRLAVKSDAVLFSHDDVTPGSGDVRFKVNKAATANTASLLFQSNWSGHAEMGLIGNNDFALKVSTNGSAWKDAMRVNAQSGNIVFPERPYLSLLRDTNVRLGSARTYQVPFEVVLHQRGNISTNATLDAVQIQEDGVYLVAVTISTSSRSTGSADGWYATLKVNGQSVNGSYESPLFSPNAYTLNGVEIIGAFTVVRPLSSGDLLELYIESIDSTAALLMVSMDIAQVA